MDALGNINWWGFSPALDLQSIYHQLSENRDKKSDSESDELNILIVGAGDPRHILKTLANKATWSRKKLIRFYIYETRLELYARNCLLLSLAIENPNKLGIQEKTEFFMEIFANILVRDQTAQYVQNASTEFIKCITDFDYKDNKKKLSLFDFSLLKFKERDFLEHVFKYWRVDTKQSGNSDFFPAKKCWDLRLRTQLGTRYDSRSNAFDWDFSMKLTDRNVQIIHNRIYGDWRETGVAFELRDANYDVPNLTLASATVFDDPRKLDKQVRRGYFGDIVIGPFLCYGVETGRKELLAKANDKFKFTAVDITKSNVSSCMEDILRLKGFQVKSTENEALDKLNDLKIVELDEEKTDDDDDQVKLECGDEYLQFEDVDIVYLPMSALAQDLPNKARFDKHFDVVYFSNCGCASFNSALKKTMKQNAVVIFETAKYLIELSNEQINGFSRRLIQIANENGFACFEGENYERLSGESDESKKEKLLEQLDYFKFVNRDKI